MSTKKTTTEVCQCSMARNIHFYMFVSSFLEGTMKLCQCSMASNIHFYLITRSMDIVSKIVSMLYGEQHSFLRKRAILSSLQAVWCQCSMASNIHFYAITFTNDAAAEILCQCSMASNIHFYGTLLKPLILGTFKARFCR